VLRVKSVKKEYRYTGIERSRSARISRPYKERESKCMPNGPIEDR
jgi:hypothetical protein